MFYLSKSVSSANNIVYLSQGVFIVIKCSLSRFRYCKTRRIDFFLHLPHLFCFHGRDLFSLGDGSNMKIEVLFLFLVPGAYYCKADFCRETTSSIWYDHALIGHVIKSLLTRGIFACAHKCLSLSGCTSYNYETSAPQGYGVCELNGRGSRSDNPHITRKHGFAFAQVRKTIKVRIMVINITLE